MKKVLFVLVGMLLLIGCVGQTKNSTNNENDFEKEKLENIQIEEFIDTIVDEQLIVNEELEITFEEIDSLLYFEYKNAYDSRIVFDSSKIVKEGSYFTLSIADRDTNFHCSENFDSCQYYKGFSSVLNSYIITTCKNSYGAGFCWRFLLDEKTGEKFKLNNPFDSQCSSPFLSKKGKRMIVFSSSIFSVSSSISLYEKNESVYFNDTLYKTYNSNNWSIEELVWVDENTIGLKVYSYINRDKIIEYISGRIN